MFFLLQIKQQNGRISNEVQDKNIELTQFSVVSSYSYFHPKYDSLDLVVVAVFISFTFWPSISHVIILRLCFSLLSTILLLLICSALFYFLSFCLLPDDSVWQLSETRQFFLSDSVMIGVIPMYDQIGLETGISRVNNESFLKVS